MLAHIVSGLETDEGRSKIEKVKKLAELAENGVSSVNSSISAQCSSILQSFNVLWHSSLWRGWLSTRTRAP
jgi:hypothetical protein